MSWGNVVCSLHAWDGVRGVVVVVFQFKEGFNFFVV